MQYHFVKKSPLCPRSESYSGLAEIKNLVPYDPRVVVYISRAPFIIYRTLPQKKEAKFDCHAVVTCFQALKFVSQS